MTQITMTAQERTEVREFTQSLMGDGAPAAEIRSAEPMAVLMIAAMTGILPTFKGTGTQVREAIIEAAEAIEAEAAAEKAAAQAE